MPWWLPRAYLEGETADSNTDDDTGFSIEP